MNTPSRIMTGRVTLAWVLAGAVSVPTATAPEALRPEIRSGWDAYVRATEIRIGRELSSPQTFLVMDFAPSHPGERAAVLAGQVLAVNMNGSGQAEPSLSVPDAMVHHWRGIVLVPRVTLDRVLAQVTNPRVDAPLQDDVVEARVLDRAPGSLRMFLRLQRSQLVTVVYNTEHTVQYTRQNSTRASSRSVATRIAEVADPSTPRERELGPGQDHGFLWALNSYWRYEQIATGVLVECESVSLSRSVPTIARGAVRPLIDQIARASMERTLTAFRTRLTSTVSQGD